VLKNMKEQSQLGARSPRCFHPDTCAGYHYGEVTNRPAEARVRRASVMVFVMGVFLGSIVGFFTAALMAAAAGDS
jgi:hypothetical protein